MRTKNKVGMFLIILSCMCYYQAKSEKDSKLSNSPKGNTLPNTTNCVEKASTSQTNTMDNLIKLLLQGPESAPKEDSFLFNDFEEYAQSFQDPLQGKQPISWSSADMPQIDLFSHKEDFGFIKSSPFRNSRYQR